MKKLILTGCSLWLMAMVVAQQNIAENTLLWELSGNGLQRPSFLFGTMHLLCSEDAKISENLKKVIKETDQIYFEIDMDNIMEMMGAMKYIKMNGNVKLQDILSEADFRKIREYFEKNPSMVPLEVMQYFKPYFISSLISAKSMACATEGGMEQRIMAESRQYSKEIRGLETVAFQASVFDSIPYVQQAQELVKYIDSAEKNSDVTRELVAVYKKQDLKKIQELTEKEEGGVAEFIDVLLYNRNADWVQKIAGIIPSQTVLFAVGAAHLPGEKGLISLLRKKGFTVKPMKNDMNVSQGVSL